MLVIAASAMATANAEPATGPAETTTRQAPSQAPPTAHAKPHAEPRTQVPRKARTVPLPSVRDRSLTLGWEQETPTLERSLAEKIEDLWSERPLRRGTTAIYVVDATTGKPLYAVHEDEHLNPASNVKLVATATALDVLGPDWRYVTRLLGPSPDTAGEVHGDLYLVGSYDPTLRATDLQSMVATLSGRRVARIHGDLLVGEDAQRDALNHATISIEVTGGEPGEAPEVTVSPELDFIEVAVAAETIRRRRRPRIDIESMLVEDATSGVAVPRYRIEIAGTISAGRRATYRRRVPTRQLFAAHVLRAALAEAGIEVTGAVRQAKLMDYMATAVTSDFLPVELARHESETLSDLVTRINKRSLNALADRVIRTAGAVLYGGRPSMDKGVQAMHAWLRDRAGIDPSQVLLDTGSGLSYETELTARQIVRVLRAASGFAAPARQQRQSLDAPSPTENQGGRAQVFLSSLAVGGVDGTLRHRFRDLRGKVQAKTGTLTEVIALSGIVAESADNALAFSIVTNGNKHRKRNRVRRQHEEIVEALHRYLRTRAQHVARRGD